jgi:lipopolysaccharide export LptBFGC system permease protein LptF
MNGNTEQKKGFIPALKMTANLANRGMKNSFTAVKDNVLVLKDNFFGNTTTRTSTTIFGSLYQILLSIIDVIMSIFKPKYVSEISFFIFAILFGFIFFNATIAKNGVNGLSTFIGYCMWSWILFLLIIIVINRKALNM